MIAAPNMPLPEHALILVVERNPAVQRLERYLLEQAGYQVEFVSDGLAGFVRAQELKPHLLITEILVPKLDGLSLCHRLKTNPATSSIRVLIFSHLEAEDRAREAGADAFIGKPLNGERLVTSVEKLIRKSQAGLEP
jgi:CheY-like chemotaxis protein